MTYKLTTDRSKSGVIQHSFYDSEGRGIITNSIPGDILRLFIDYYELNETIISNNPRLEELTIDFKIK